MPNIKSAKKRVLVAERNRTRNRAWKSAVRTARGLVQETVKNTSSKNATEALKNAYSLIDRAVSKGVMHKNAAARKKSRLAVKVLTLSQAKKKTSSKSAS